MTAIPAGPARSAVATPTACPAIVRRLGGDGAFIVVCFGSIVATALFVVAAIARHRAHGSMAMDFAFFDQVVWNTSEGRWFETSFVPYNFMGQHVEPILLLFAALYLIAPAPEWLLVIQAISAGAAAIALYLLGRERLSRSWLSALVAFSFLLSPTLRGALAFDYHSEIMAPLFIFSGLALLHQGRTRVAVALLAGTLLLKEDAALVLVGLALPVWFLGRRVAAATLATLGVVWIAIVVGVYMPWARGGASDLEARYEHLGSGAGGIASGVLSDPVGAARHALGAEQRGAMLRQVVYQGGAPLLAPISLAASLPVVGLQFLSSHPPQQGLRLHYGGQALPLIVVATIEGLRRVERSPRSPRLATGVAASALVAGTLWGVCLAGPFPLGDPNPASGSGTTDDAFRRAARLIPADASVSAQSGLAAHMSQREQIQEFPILDDADYVILDLDGVVARPYQQVYGAEVAALPSRGYELLWSDTESGLRVYVHKGVSR